MKETMGWKYNGLPIMRRWFPLWVVNSSVKSVAVCFVLGWWVQCHVRCQKRCCACWSWWNTESYESSRCTGDTWLGSV